MATADPKPVRIFKCIPLDNSWVLPGTKHDLKAIYRRPRRSVGEYDEIIQERAPDGRPLWDILGPIPLRRHADWTAKGYEYVTVVSAPHVDGSGWPQIAASLRAKGLEPRDYLQHPVYGTWNPKLYLDTADRADVDKFAELRAAVQMFGSEAVLAIRKQADPTFALPDVLMGIPAGGLKKPVTSDAAEVDAEVGHTPSVASAAKKPAKKKPAEVQG